jgi:hypothetical protein
MEHRPAAAGTNHRKTTGPFRAESGHAHRNQKDSDGNSADFTL